MPTAEQVLEVAYSQLGYTEAPDGGEYKYCPAMGWEPFSQWCGIFMGWCVVQAGGTYGGADTTVPALHYTPTAAEAYRSRGDWHLEPEVGDHIFFDWGGGSLGSDLGLIDHIGIVADNSTWGDGWLTTVEGNITSGSYPQVGQFQRSAAVISGFGRPRYAATTPTPALPEQIFEEDGMVIIRSSKGWYSVIGGRLIPILGGGQFAPLGRENVAQVKVSDAQLALIKAAFA